MPSPEQSVRRNYPLHLPVSVKLAHKERHTQSENTSLNGSGSRKKEPQFAQEENRNVTNLGLLYTPAWHTET
jgi:hypothetical protein